jgi:hypothetical protein
LFLCVSLVASAGAVSAQSSDPCDLFPDNPADITTKAPTCTASYWQRVGTKFFGGLHEFGATVAIVKFANASAAAQAMAKLKMGPGWSQASYGDGGMEKSEDATKIDMRTPTPEEVARKAMQGDLRDLTGERDYGLYSAIFSCGSNMVYVNANPSKGPAARQLVNDLDKNLKSQNVCGSTTRAPVSPPVTVTGPTTPVSPPTTVDDGNVGGTRYFDGKAANEIMNARANGSRYMAVLSRSYDSARGCFVEERAWISSIKASNTERVSAVVGPSITVCVKGAILDQATINENEVKLQNSRNQLAKALKAKSEFERYLNDPKYSQWAKGEIAKIDVYINQYETYISQTQAGMSASTPPPT